MTIEFKDYAKDIKLNISSVLKTSPDSKLTENQIFIIALASAYTTKNQKIVDFIFEKSVSILSDIEIEASKSASTIMAMNNVFYRFGHLVSDDSYSSMPAQLRMNVMANSAGINKSDFELASLAVSTINGCGMCIDSHVEQITASGVSKGSIHHAVRIASVVNALSQVDFIS